MAKALAALSGLTEAPSPRSSLTYEEGLMTCQLKSSRPFESFGEVAGCLGSLCRKHDMAYEDIGRIKMLRNGSAAFFDVPISMYEVMKDIDFQNGLSLSVPDSLSEFYQEEYDAYIAELYRVINKDKPGAKKPPATNRETPARKVWAKKSLPSDKAESGDVSLLEKTYGEFGSAKSSNFFEDDE